MRSQYKYKNFTIKCFKYICLFLLFFFPFSSNAADASFDIDATAGVSPFTVNFEYIGDGNPVNSFLWDFGDGNTSTEQNPSHTYSTENLMRLEPSLTVTDGSGSNTKDVDVTVYPTDFVPERKTYYIDATLGDDSNDGLSSENAKQSLNAISNPRPGDTVLYKRGEVWEDLDVGAALYIRESGFEGAPITYGAYGNFSDSKPAIKRQAILPGWSDPDNWVNLSFAEGNSLDWGARVASPAYGSMNSRSMLPANYLSQDGTRIRIKAGGSLVGDVPITSAYIGEQADSGDVYDMEPGTITQITFSGSNSVILSGGETQYSDWIDYDFDHTKDYIISLFIEGNAKGMYATGEDHEDAYYKFTTVSEAGNADASSGYNHLSAYWNLVAFGIDNPAITNSNTWYISANGFQDPERVWFNGEEAGVTDNRGRLNSTDKWMYEYNSGNPRFYVYSNSGNPASVFSSIKMAGIYGSPITLINKDYLIFRELDFQGGRGTGMNIDGGYNIIVEDCNVGKDSGTHGLKISNSDSGRYSRNGIIRNSNIDADNHVENYWHAETTDDGLAISTGVVNWSLYGNYVAGWAHTGIPIESFDDNYLTINNDVYNNYITCPDTEYGRGFATSGNEGSIYNNKFHHNIIKDTHTRSQMQSKGVEFYNNIIDGVTGTRQERTNHLQGLMVYRPTDEDTNELKIFNNVIANTEGVGIAFSSNNVEGDYYDNTIANNIFYNTGLMPFYGVWDGDSWIGTADIHLVLEDLPTSMHDNFYQNNILYNSLGDNFIFYGNDPADDYVKTLLEFNAMNGTNEETIINNISENPLFIDPNNSLGPDNLVFTDDDGFRLQSESSAIDAGADIPSEVDYSSNSIYGIPDIGAIEYQPPYTMGVDQVDIGANVRLYGDGKFRNKEVPNLNMADLSIVPDSDDTGLYMDVDINIWETSGDYSKKWIEDSPNFASTETGHTVGDLKANQNYIVYYTKEGGSRTKLTSGTSNLSGELTFNYTAGYSAVVFEIEEGSNSSSGGGGGGGVSNTDRIPPDVPTGFNIITKDDSNTINWINPIDYDFSGVKLFRTTTPIITDISITEIFNIGVQVYEGEGDTYVDALLTPGIYYYGLSSYDVLGNYSDFIVASTTITTAVNGDNNIEIDDDCPNILSLYGASNEATVCVSQKEAKEIYLNNEYVLLNQTCIDIYNRVYDKKTSLHPLAKYSLAYFIFYGTKTTKALGAGERGGVVGSFKSAFGKMPTAIIDWQDVVKISNGRWPSQINQGKENEAKIKFRKIYLRDADMNNANDNAAITIMAYGLRPVERNMDSEATGIKIFKNIYKYNPSSALDWDIVRAISYSGAKR